MNKYVAAATDDICVREVKPCDCSGGSRCSHIPCLRSNSQRGFHVYGSGGGTTSSTQSTTRLCPIPGRSCVCVSVDVSVGVSMYT